MRAGVWASSSGQGLVEYSLIILFVALAVFVALQALGTSLDAFYQAVVAAFGGG